MWPQDRSGSRFSFSPLCCSLLAAEFDLVYADFLRVRWTGIRDYYLSSVCFFEIFTPFLPSFLQDLVGWAAFQVIGANQQATHYDKQKQGTRPELHCSLRFKVSTLWNQGSFSGSLGHNFKLYSAMFSKALRTTNYGVLDVQIAKS